MRATWPYLAIVATTGTVLGVIVGRLPGATADVAPTRPPTTTVPAGSVGTLDPPVELDTLPAPTTTVAATTVPATTVPVTAPATTVAPVTTAPAATEPPATEPPATEPPATVPPASEVPLRAPGDVRLVLANGDGRFDLVGRNVDRLRPLGYTQIDQTDVDTRYGRTIIFFRDGFEREASRLAADLLVPAAELQPLADQVITSNDGAGDLIAVLGPDAVR